jgi:hypothetical protein
MPKASEIKDKFHTFEGELFQLFASNMRENCNGHGLKILNKSSNGEIAFDLAELVLNHCDINYYMSSFRKRSS